MESLIVIFRTALIYFIVFLVMRLMGKREIGKLSVFDLVISIMIAESAVFVVEDTKRPIWDGILPMLTLLVIQVSIAFISLKNRTLRVLFDGSPSMLINNGKLDMKEMRRQRYTLDDLMQQLREQQVENLNDVQFAMLETTGKLSVILKDQQGESKANSNSNASQEKEGSKNPIPSSGEIRYVSLPLPLIMDGKVQDENLEKISKTRFWLKNQIQAKGASDFKEIFFCTIDHKGQLFIDHKESD
ncbi:hypothetical protein BVG16_06475 [Paenibacillus selenitireducens]|uniref:YetF C-terminal domain-containing protein n=1 Tax=Paenibacillus selenitireducens TaxID=1324314 RepID=A0A1T2XKJ8_9BACL|nr:DUF421 domain-containing protein [Paenibacillus selenitireducens]OPA80374.1 hypothetical protein BVG16_06475 [Paenibacillus selenitireducens]